MENTEGVSDIDRNKDLLLADHEYFGESLQRNETSGESRVNFLITLLAGVPVLIVGLTEKKEVNIMENEVTRNMLTLGLGIILIFGLFVFPRLVKRNRITDEFKFALDRIRQQYKDTCDPSSYLNYRVGPTDENPMVLINKGEKNESAPKKQSRGRGSLAHLVAALNSVNIFLIVSLFLYNNPPFAVLILAAGISVLAMFLQESFLKEDESRTKSKIDKQRYTHAGGIVFRKRAGGVHSHGDARSPGEIEYLVTTSKDTKPKNVEDAKQQNVDRQKVLGAEEKTVEKKYIFPKGHIDRGEEISQAALREVYEETGVIGRIIRPAGTYVDRSMSDPSRVMLYVIEHLGEGKSNEGREVHWLGFQPAWELLSYEESKNLLLQAHSFLRGMPEFSGDLDMQVRPEFRYPRYFCRRSGWRDPRGLHGRRCRSN